MKLPDGTITVNGAEMRQKLVACFSVPRLSFSDHLFCVMDGIGKLGLRWIERAGAYWHKCLCLCMEDAIAGGAEFILTLDYDTVFAPQDVVNLYALMLACPQADAIMAMQCKRDGDSILAWGKGADGKSLAGIAPDEFGDDLIPCASGHFGLTILRASALAKMSRPWFSEVHDDDGRWGEGSIEADVSFWHRFHRDGLRLYLAPRIVVGHAQLLVTWPGVEGKPVHQYPTEYRRTGKPDAAWQ